VSAEAAFAELPGILENPKFIKLIFICCTLLYRLEKNDNMKGKTIAQQTRGSSSHMSGIIS